LFLNLIDLCIARLGSVTNSILSPKIEKTASAPAAVWVGAGMCYLSFFCAGCLSSLMHLHSNKKTETAIKTSDSRTSETSSETEGLLASQKSIKRQNTQEHHEAGLGDIFLLPLSFWLICFICVQLYGTVVPFNNIASDFLMSKWYPGDTETAGAVMRQVFFYFKKRRNYIFIV
jgi:hypothetical protein